MTEPNKPKVVHSFLTVTCPVCDAAPNKSCTQRKWHRGYFVHDERYAVAAKKNKEQA